MLNNERAHLSGYSAGGDAAQAAGSVYGSCSAGAGKKSGRTGARKRKAPATVQLLQKEEKDDSKKIYGKGSAGDHTNME